MTKDQAFELIWNVVKNLKLTVAEHQAVAKAMQVLQPQAAESQPAVANRAARRRSKKFAKVANKK